MRRSFHDLIRCLSAIPLLALPALASGQMEERGKPMEEGMEKHPDIEISRSAICMRVEEREPVEIDTVFRPDVGELFAYTQVEGIREPTQITHVWYHGDREIFRRDLEIGNSGWRTWTSKKILPSWTGPWKVAILDPDGNPLKTLEFTIAESTSGEPMGPDE